MSLLPSVNNLQTPGDMVKQSALFDDSVPTIIKRNRQTKQFKSKLISTYQNMNEPISSRKEQHLLIYIINVVLSFCLSFQNIYLVFTNDQFAKGLFSIGMCMSTVLISLFTTSRLCNDKWKIFNLYILLDNIFLAQVASAFGFVGFLMVIYTGYWYQIITMMAFLVQIIFFVGNFRILMLCVNWSKWRIILYKLVLLADAVVFFEVGSYYMSTDFAYSGGSDKNLDGKVKDFVLLYVFGLFALFVQMYTKISDVDQTAELKYEYTFKQMEQSKKIEKIRRSVIGLNIQMQASKKLIEQKRRRSYIQAEQISQKNELKIQ